ncbi:MAG: glycosyltransferase family 2 protein, partial [Candidatus Competibacter sp.]|nr:glycosyltransferase family 2 protein [Candidatus Competibacter sp.]
MPMTDIILPVHNGLSLLRDGLDAAMAHTPRRDCRLLIADDASDPVVAAYLRDRAAAAPDWIALRRQDENLGFLESCNRAMAQGDSKYLVLLNSDVLVGPNWLERMLACAESDPRIAAVNPLSNRADNIDLPMAPGASYLAMNAYLARQRRGRCHDVVTGVGFCLLLRRSALDRVGLFDPLYGHGYCEESDLCMRLIAAGFRTVVAEDVYVFHRGGGSFSDGHARYLNNRRLFDQRWGADYRRQFRAFRRADPLKPVRRLFALPARWEPTPALWQGARELLGEWRGGGGAGQKGGGWRPPAGGGGPPAPG